MNSNDDDHNVVFEIFEASPSSKDILAADNTLQWDFPGRAVQIPHATFSEPLFLEQLALFIEQASTEQLVRFMANGWKARASVPETRDSADPAIISQMLMPMLEAIGSSVDVPRLRKRVRDDVNIFKAQLPWRRLPLWLVLRVAVQRHLCLMLGSHSGRACYKFLTCVLLAQLLVDSAGQLAPELTVLLRPKTLLSFGQARDGQGGGATGMREHLPAAVRLNFSPLQWRDPDRDAAGRIGLAELSESHYIGCSSSSSPGSRPEPSPLLEEQRQAPRRSPMPSGFEEEKISIRWCFGAGERRNGFRPGAAAYRSMSPAGRS